ncbi:DUF418 domain-containing protein [Nocardiopsis baichengensis]|uniref:DUF418 domain-containing protein n=1 Tax=Nocardiopsis baichengensis TaxID=280240 RepID=UPI0003826386|nr:DUF418 domain-containing protein [Nocardiopsis baichengensis]
MVERRRRIDDLDVLRGFALCGILLVNIGPVTQMGYDAVLALGPGEAAPLAAPEAWLDMLVAGRFFPIFSFLFGIGFAIFLESAGRRHPRPRLLLVRRLVALGLLGAAHQVLHPGEALTPYAVFGLLVLLPASYLPRWAVLALGAVGAVVPAALGSGGMLLIPGMFLLGMAVARYRVPERLGELTGWTALVFALLAAASVPAALWQFGEVRDTGFTASSAVAGLLMAGAYTSGIALLMRTPAAGALRAVFAPLGRMALTNYVAATPVVFAVGLLLDFRAEERWGALFALAGVLLAAQWAFSALWLRAFRYGPLEWAWRCATWWEAVPLRVSRPAPPGPPSPPSPSPSAPLPPSAPEPGASCTR